MRWPHSSNGAAAHLYGYCKMIETIKRFFAPAQQKESRTSAVIFTGNKSAEWGKRNPEAFAKDGYQKNVIAYQAISKTAQAVAAIRWYVADRNGEELSGHPMLALINNPNPVQSWKEFIEATIGFYRISGNAYIERVVVGGKAKELYPLRPDRMTIKPGQSGIPSGYVYRVGMDSVTFDVDPSDGDSDVLHLRAFNPLDDWYGMSPIEAGAYAIDIHNESQASVMALLQNSMTPSGAIESTGQLSDEEFSKLRAEMDAKYSGAKNTGRPLLLDGGLKWVQMGLTPQTANIIENKYSSARDISLALGVPPLLLNIPGDSTYSNYKEARLAFYEETVIPLATRLRDELNEWLGPMFGAALEIDVDQIPAVAEKRSVMWDMADRATDLTINERRAMKGYPPVDGGDEVYISTGAVPLSFDIEPPSADAKSAARDAYGR